MIRKLLQKHNYNKSNKTLTARFPISKRAISISTKLLKTKSTELRQRMSDDLLDELADAAKINIVKLKISDKNQSHKKAKGRVVYKQYGYYKPGSKYIYINNRTAVRGQILAPKTFFDTLLHEWMHHYDHEKLGLNSIHTAGFYARLKDIKTKLGYFEV